MKILLLSTDELTAQFDRRILNLAECLVNNGNEVMVQTIGKNARLCKINLQMVVQFPRSFSSVSADKARHAFFNETSYGKEMDLASEARSMNFARIVWSRLPARLRPHVYRVYSSVVHFLSSLSNSYPGDLADSYFSDAYSFWEANRQEDYDLVIATDVTSGIAAVLLTAGSNKSWWYEAHEFATEQEWLKDHHGFTSELITIENLLVKGAHIFSSVSDKIVLFMEETFGRDKHSVVLYNSTRSKQDELNLQDSIPKLVLDSFHVPENRILFHGVLSDFRGLSSFVEAFESASLQNWKFILIGYNPGTELLRALRRAKNCILLSSVNSQQVGHLVRISDVVLMPYPVKDINTKYGFPNKLGDCIAEKIPFLYNKELEAIDEVATLTNTGVPFSWSDLQKPGELRRILNDLETLTPDWEKAEKLFGWTNFEATIVELLSDIKKKI